MNEHDKQFLTSMTNSEVRNFFLKADSYMTVNFPMYFKFDYLLEYAVNLLGTKSINSIWECLTDTDYSRVPDVNYTFLMSKSKDSYRENTLIHPLLYVDLVNLLTKEENWKELQKRYAHLDSLAGAHIRCESMPFEMPLCQDRSKYALHFWERMEQESIRLSIEFSHLLQVDITDFYSSIHLNMLSWAIHGEDEAKQNFGNPHILGTQIIQKLQDMNYRQTVGIPQGNQLSDFLAELLMRYLDACLVKRLAPYPIDYQILRYRDDYRIFTCTKEAENLIKRELIALLGEHKLKLNTEKTKSTSELVLGSIKEDKLYWIEHDPVMKTTADWKKFTVVHDEYRGFLPNRIYKTTVQKHLLTIKMLADKHPNSGQLVKAIKEFEERIANLTLDELKHTGADVSVLIAITFDLVRNNPKIVDVGVKLLSRLFGKESIDVRYGTFIFTLLDDDIIMKVLGKETNIVDSIEKEKLIKAMVKVLSYHGENSYLEIWLQRIVVRLLYKNRIFNRNYVKDAKNRLVQLVNDIVLFSETEYYLFNESWVKEEFRINLNEFIDKENLVYLSGYIDSSEIKIKEYNIY